MWLSALLCMSLIAFDVGECNPNLDCCYGAHGHDGIPVPLAQRIKIFGRVWCAKSAPFWINYYARGHCQVIIFPYIQLWRALDLWCITLILINYHVGSVGSMGSFLLAGEIEISCCSKSAPFWIIISEINMQIKSYRRSRRAPCQDWTVSGAWTACLVRLLFDRLSRLTSREAESSSG